MGLDAAVMCNCIKEGLKIPERFKRYFEIDEEGYPALTLPYPGNEDIHLEFDNWLSAGCPHPNMDFVNERVSNWPGVRLFQEFLQNLSSDVFEIILDEIPNVNGGLVPPYRAEKMLYALQKFKDTNQSLEKTVLVDSHSGYIIFEYIPAYEGKMILSGREGINLGISKDHFFIENLNGIILFSSKKFEQIIIDQKKTENYLESPVVYKDCGTGASFKCTTAICGEQIPWPDGEWQNKKGKVRFKYPKKLQIRSVIRTINDYFYIVEPLIKVCEASIKTKNPIRWR